MNRHPPRSTLFPNTPPSRSPALRGRGQRAIEERGSPPVLLHRPDIDDRLPIFLVSLAGMLSVGYLSATYASRLHELIAEAGEQFEAVRRRGRRRRSLAAKAAVDVRRPLQDLEKLADALEADSADPREVAGKLRMGVMQLDAELSQLADVGELDEEADRPEPVNVRRVVDDCLIALQPRLAHHTVNLDVAEYLNIVGDHRAARRIVLNLLENVADHTPPGTTVGIRARRAAGSTVLAVDDNGPGVPADMADKLFATPDQ